MSTLDKEELFASIDLVQRSGARSVEFGHLEDDVPVHLARWWAKAQYRGAILQVDEHVGPVEALAALAQRILGQGARCRRCGRTISVDAPVGNRLARRRACHWRRAGSKWEPGCGRPIDHSIPTAPR